MRLPVFLLLASTAMTDAFAQSLPVQMQVGPEKPILTITVAESVQSAPTVATVGVGVQSLAATAVEGFADNARRMDAVVKMLKSRKIADKDIQTSGISIGAEYDYRNQEPGALPRFVGYRVSNTVRVTTRDIGKIGDLMDAMVKTGGTSIEGPYFSIEDSRALISQARTRALANADAQARDYATKAGFASARMVSVTEGQNFVRAYDIVATAASASAPPPPPPPPVSTPVAPGQMATGVNLTLQYLLEK